MSGRWRSSRPGSGRTIRIRRPCVEIWRHSGGWRPGRERRVLRNPGLKPVKTLGWRPLSLRDSFHRGGFLAEFDSMLAEKCHELPAEGAVYVGIREDIRELSRREKGSSPGFQSWGGESRRSTATLRLHFLLP